MRPHIEMAAIDFADGWLPMPGFDGLRMKVLADDLDEARGTGARSRLVRFEAGTTTTGRLSHPYWEEVFLIHGDLYARDGSAHAARGPTYSLRPPGTAHGPFGSDAGCLLLEVQYFAAATDSPSTEPETP